MLLPPPTVELVNAEGDKFNSEYRVIEEALGQLLRAFPHNAENSHVLLKVVAVNNLYGAGIPKKYVDTVARHITGLHIDAALAEGKSAVVDDIINCGVLKEKYFSFGSKFCSWHNPTAYPLYDRYVDECLWSYKKQDHFTTYRRGSYSYQQFVKVVTAFRTFYGLTSVTFKQLDKFLWSLGGLLIAEKDKRKAARPGR
ncbi:MAG TPA: hypothetical protein VN176_10045 [Verrucomicrobiae bacterium]|nr:hypothetical protein [Verrucomicrobiae bacterium]